jgi:hypothetical protein
MKLFNKYEKLFNKYDSTDKFLATDLSLGAALTS